jgi:hypothetical protein
MYGQQNKKKIAILVRWQLRAKDLCLLLWYFGALSVYNSKATGSYLMRSRRSVCQAHRSFPYSAEEGRECGSMYRQAPPYLKLFVSEPDFRGPGSVPGQWTWDLCETEWDRGKFFSERFGFTPSASFRQCFVPACIHLPSTVHRLSDGKHSAFALIVWLPLN